MGEFRRQCASCMKRIGAASVLFRRTVERGPVNSVSATATKDKVWSNSPRSIHYAPPPRSRLVSHPSRSIWSCDGLSRSYIHSAVLVIARCSLSPDLSPSASCFSAHRIGSHFPPAHFVEWLPEIDLVLRVLLTNGMLERVLLVVRFPMTIYSCAEVISQTPELSVIRASHSQLLQTPAFLPYPAILCAVLIPPDALGAQS